MAVAVREIGMSASVLQLYRKVSAWPLGHWLFSRLVSFKAPYFASIRPVMTLLEPNREEATIAHRRSVTNHLGTVHAIALCNLAEFVGGLMTDASIPSTMRWIPSGMTVQYLKKAVGRQHALATPAFVRISRPKPTNCRSTWWSPTRRAMR